MSVQLERVRKFLQAPDPQIPSSMNLTRLGLQVRFVAAVVGMGGVAFLAWRWGSIQYVRSFMIAWAAYLVACASPRDDQQ